jgi:GNAT superfamily N-acetyltransferase
MMLGGRSVVLYELRAMATSNFERMMQLADAVFAVRDDPDQLDVNEEVLEHLAAIHPATVSEEDDGNGPVAWVLLIPTTQDLMEKFLAGAISERQLYERTPLGVNYDAVYLCSGLVLEEHRRKGIAKRLTLEAIDRIRRDHPIRGLFMWAFTPEGRAGGEAIARWTGLPLYQRTAAHS